MQNENNKPKKTKRPVRVDSLPSDILPLPYHSDKKGTPQIDDGTQNAADIYDILPDGMYDRFSD